MVKKLVIRKLLLEVDEQTLDYMNDYKYAVLTQQGVAINNSDVLAEAIKMLEASTAAKQNLLVRPRPGYVRVMEATRRESLRAGKEKKVKQSLELDAESPQSTIDK